MSEQATGPRPGSAGPVVACVKWVDLRPEVDHVHGTVTPSSRGAGWSAADRAAVEIALRLAERWDRPSAVVCAGPESAETGLRELLAAGVDRAVRVECSSGQGSATVADVLAPVLLPGDLGAAMVVCGDLSADRGSGAVPALLAHHLGAPQALGLIAVEAGDEGPGDVDRVRAVRRLDGARRELVQLDAPGVISVEGGVAELRRASLRAALGGLPTVERRPGRFEHHVEPPRLRPWRPRARVLPAPQGATAFDRVVHLTDALVDRTPPQVVEAEPAAAARLILDQLRTWGYVGGPG